MLNNKDVVNRFYNYSSGYNKNMTSHGNRLYSYNTCIAERKVVKGKEIIIKNVTYYSKVTTQHQSLVTKYDATVNGLPLNTLSL